jgi:3-oxoacyl-[acyl-carrier protein] reductase
MDLGIKGKVAMVAAGSKGIGLAAAKSLSADGVKVSLCGRSADSAAESAAEVGGGAKGYGCDVSDPGAIEAWYKSTVADLGQPLILVTNTGGPPAGNVLDLTDEQWQAGVDSSLLNIVRMVRLAAPAMKDAHWGRIIHITSLVAKEPSRVLAISSTLRSGIMALTKLQAWQLAEFGVTVNGVLPGHTDTDRQAHLVKLRAEREGIPFEEAKAKQSADTPMKRFAEPREIGDVIAFLCSEKASYVSGASLLVDGATTAAFG